MFQLAPIHNQLQLYVTKSNSPAIHGLYVDTGLIETMKMGLLQKLQT